MASFVVQNACFSLNTRFWQCLILIQQTSALPRICTRVCVLVWEYGKPNRTILSNTIFSWSKLIFAWANVLLHGQIYNCMAKFIIQWANVLFHGHIYYSMCNLLFPWANSYYCMRKSSAQICVLQTSQLTRFDRVTHGFMVNLKVSR